MVLTWHTDRLHRSPVELEGWIDATQAHGVSVHTVKAGPIDLATPSGRMVARQLGAVARYEVEHAIERQKAAKAQAAAAGKFRGGRRAFGFEPDGITVRAVEAAVIRETVDQALAGESLRSLAAGLNERGVETAGPAERWTPTALRKMLTRARNAGLVEHEGVVVADAEWPAIVDPARWRNLVRMLSDPERRTAPMQTSERYLGSGVYLCGRCADGTPMVLGATTRRTRSGERRPAYKCRSSHHLTRLAEPLDEFVRDVVVGRLSQPDARLMLAPVERRVDVETLHEQRADVEARLAELAGLFAEGVLTGAQLAEGTRVLRAEGDRLDGELSATQGVSPLAGFADAEDVAAAWEAAPMGRRKAVIRALMTVIVLPANRGRPQGWQPGAGYFNREFVKIEWRA